MGKIINKSSIECVDNYTKKEINKAFLYLSDGGDKDNLTQEIQTLVLGIIELTNNYGLHIKSNELLNELFEKIDEGNNSKYKDIKYIVNKILTGENSDCIKCPIIKENKNLKMHNIQLKEESTTDLLTQLSNRRSIENKLDELIEQYPQNTNIFSVILLDIDYFKKVNDTFGHDVGDKVLKGIGELLNANLRENDLKGRWGGEEFLLILNSTNHKSALAKAEIIRKDIEENLINFIKTSENPEDFCPHTKGCSSEKDCKNSKMECFPSIITCSLGVATIKNDNGVIESKSHLVKRADSALYIAKEKGRNIVCSGKDIQIPNKREEQN